MSRLRVGIFFNFYKMLMQLFVHRCLKEFFENRSADVATAAATAPYLFLFILYIYIYIHALERSILTSNYMYIDYILSGNYTRNVLIKFLVIYIACKNKNRNNNISYKFRTYTYMYKY